MNKQVITSSFLLCACLTTGCSTSMLNNDQFRLSGTPEGIRAFSDTLSGIAVLAKTEPGALPSNPHTALRVAQEVEQTNRFKFQYGLKAQKGGK